MQKIYKIALKICMLELRFRFSVRLNGNRFEILRFQHIKCFHLERIRAAYTHFYGCEIQFFPPCDYTSRDACHLKAHGIILRKLITRGRIWMANIGWSKVCNANYNLLLLSEWNQSNGNESEYTLFISNNVSQYCGNQSERHFYFEVYIHFRCRAYQLRAIRSMSHSNELCQIIILPCLTLDRVWREIFCVTLLPLPSFFFNFRFTDFASFILPDSFTANVL